MKLILHDTLTLLEPLFCEPSRPDERLEKARPVLYGADGLFRRHKLVQRAQRTALFEVMQAGAVDGYSVVNGQQGWGLFNPLRRLEASWWTFDRFRQEDVPGMIRDGLETAAGFLPPQRLPGELNVFLFPADPADRALMLRSHGLSVFAGAPGSLLVQLWPSEGNLARLNPMLTRALVHAMHTERREVSTLADVLALEGSAARVVEAQFPSLPHPWLVAFRPPATWQADLTHAAELSGVRIYDKIRANIYGGDGSTITPIPDALRLDEDDLDYADAVMKEMLSTHHPPAIAAHMYGDEVVSPQGHPRAGMPPFAGFEVGYRFEKRVGV